MYQTDLDPAGAGELDPTGPDLAAQPEPVDHEALAGEPVAEDPLVLAFAALDEDDLDEEVA